MKRTNFIILFFCIYQLYECEIITNINDDYEEITLNEDWNQHKFDIIKSAYKFINNNISLIYIFESQANSTLTIHDEDSKGLKTLNILRYNSYLTVNKSGVDTETIKISSISSKNVNIQLLLGYNYDNLYLKQKFTNIRIIEAKYNLIATFDSFDENTEVYFQKYTEDIVPKDFYPINKYLFNKINIKDDIIKLEKDSTYIIINDVTEFYFSSLEFFITEENSISRYIDLVEKKEKYLYLNKDRNYILKLDSNENSRLFKLSRKTINSKIASNGNIILNKENMYYKLENNNDLHLRPENEDALIEFLYNFEDEKVFDKLEVYKEKLDTNTNKILIKLDSPDDYVIKLESDLSKPFGTSIYGKISKENYHYYSSECHSSLIYGYSFEESFKKDKFTNVNAKGGEFYMLYLYIDKTNKEQPLYLTYYPKNLNVSSLNAANYTYFEIKHNVTYKFIIENDDSFTFTMNIKDKDLKSYNPLFTFENKTDFNEAKLVMKNEGNNKNTPVYINYYQNWEKKDDVMMTVIADKAKSILLVIYIIAIILILVFFALVVLAVMKIIKIQKDKAEDSNKEVILKDY